MIMNIGVSDLTNTVFAGKSKDMDESRISRGDVNERYKI